MKWLAALLLLGAANAVAAEPSETLPSDVKEYFFREEGCDYFESQPVFNAERRALVTKRTAELRCAELSNDHAALIRKYMCTQVPYEGFYCRPEPEHVPY